MLFHFVALICGLFFISGALLHFLRRQKHHLKDKISQLLDICNQVRDVWCDSALLQTQCVPHTCSHHFSGHFTCESLLSPINFLLPIIPNHCFLLGQTKTFHILFNTISSSGVPSALLHLLPSQSIF